MNYTEINNEVTFYTFYSTLFISNHIYTFVNNINQSISLNLQLLHLFHHRSQCITIVVVQALVDRLPQPEEIIFGIVILANFKRFVDMQVSFRFRIVPIVRRPSHM